MTSHRLLHKVNGGNIPGQHVAFTEMLFFFVFFCPAGGSEEEWIPSWEDVASSTGHGSRGEQRVHWTHICFDLKKLRKFKDFSRSGRLSAFGFSSHLVAGSHGAQLGIFAGKEPSLVSTNPRRTPALCFPGRLPSLNATGQASTHWIYP